jgi:hypothetical protein
MYTMIFIISSHPAASLLRYVESTKSTLEFACRAKLVKTHAKVNVVEDDAARLRKAQQALREKDNLIQQLQQQQQQQRLTENVSGGDGYGGTGAALVEHNHEETRRLKVSVRYAFDSTYCAHYYVVFLLIWITTPYRDKLIV